MFIVPVPLSFPAVSKCLCVQMWIWSVVDIVIGAIWISDCKVPVLEWALSTLSYNYHGWMAYIAYEQINLES